MNFTNRHFCICIKCFIWIYFLIQVKSKCFCLVAAGELTLFNSVCSRKCFWLVSLSTLLFLRRDKNRGRKAASWHAGIDPSSHRSVRKPPAGIAMEPHLQGPESIFWVRDVMVLNLPHPCGHSVHWPCASYPPRYSTPAARAHQARCLPPSAEAARVVLIALTRCGNPITRWHLAQHTVDGKHIIRE